MTYSNTYSSPSSPTNFIPFSGMGMRKGGRATMMPSNYQGDGSTLDLDFTTGVWDSRLTFTRSTTATYINSSGYVTSAAINAPRFDYSPTNIGEPRGLLVEGQAVNLCLQSNSLATTWTVANTNTPSVVSPSVNDPFGGTQTWKIVPTAGFAYHAIRQNFASLGTSTYTISCFVKAAQYDKFIISDLTNGVAAATFDLTAATATPVAGGSTPTARITAYANGWYRCEMTVAFIYVGATGLSFSGYPTGATIGAYGAQFNPNGTDGIYMAGAQVELSSASAPASSYIPTSASQETRTLDTCYMSGISSWFNESAGTVISNLHYNGSATDNSGIELSVGTGSSPTNRIGIRKGYVDYYSGGGLAQAEMYPTVTSGNVRIGTAYSLNDFAMCSNGGIMRTDVTGAVPVGLNTLKLYADNGTSSLVLNGLIKSIKYFPTRLSNAQLQTLTTP